jgi:hypothetical protein
MLDLVIAARRKDLGGFEVGRVCRSCGGAWSGRSSSSTIWAP